MDYKAGPRLREISALLSKTGPPFSPSLYSIGQHLTYQCLLGGRLTTWRLILLILWYMLKTFRFGFGIGSPDQCIGVAGSLWAHTW